MYNISYIYIIYYEIQSESWKEIRIEHFVIKLILALLTKQDA